MLSQTVSATSTSAPVTPPRPPSGQVPVGVIQIPASFTPGTTIVETSWFTQGFPRRLVVHTPITTAAPAAMSSGAIPAFTAPAISAVSATAIGAVAATAAVTTDAVKPEAFPDVDG